MFHTKTKLAMKLEVGMKGFILTHNACKKECVRDAYQLLNQHANTIYGPEETEKDQEIETGELVDVEKKLQEEIEAIKSIKNKDRRFQNVKTKCKNCVFISAKIEDPVCLVESIFQAIRMDKCVNSRYIYRIIPVQYTCKANMGDITKTFTNTVASHFPTTFIPEKTYLVVVKVRNNNSIGREEIIGMVGKAIKDQNESYCANLKQPNTTILFEILCTICCISYVQNYFEYHKFNMLEYLSALQRPDAPNKDD